MSKKYIRIYVNNQKIRSTGCHKWYRELVLNKFCLDANLNKKREISDNDTKNILNYYTKSFKYLLSSRDIYKPYSIKIELVKSKSSNKKVLKTVSFLFFCGKLISLKEY